MIRCSTLTIQMIVTTGLTVVVSLLVSTQSGICQQPSDLENQKTLKTGNDFRKALKSPTSVAWQEVPLRRGLRNLSDAHSIAIFLDRRVDPDHRKNFSENNKPLGYLLYKIADQLDLGICFEANTVYLGPRAAADRLPTLLEFQKSKIASLDAKIRSSIGKPKSCSWDRLAEPRQLIASLAADSNVNATNDQLVPYDVWDRGRLPSMRIDQQLSILLNGFDMMFAISGDGRSLKLLPIPANARPTINYVVPKEFVAKAKELQQDFQDVEYETRTRRLTVKGTFVQHARVYHALNPPPGDDVDDKLRGEAVYTITMTEQAGNVLASIARLLDRKLTYDPSLKQTLSQKVAIKAKEAPVEELLKQALEPLGLQYRLDDKYLLILPKD